ncbi:probable tubulin polyglutamylase ttll-15 isoform X2 [Chironomus tepperi]
MVRARRRTCNNVMITIISLIVVCVAIHTMHRYKLTDYRLLLIPQRKCNSNLRVLIIAPENDKTINHIFENLGYALVHNINDNWDILWSTTADPFNLYTSHMTKLKPHQVVNHFPPHLSHYMSYMNWGDGLKHKQKYILHSFKLPEMKKELMDYEKDSHKRFVIRDCLVNGMKVINANDNINYNASLVLQEFLDNPLLINKMILEFGVYVLMSSVNPLRIYRYNGDVDIKFFQLTDSKHFCLNPQMVSESFNKNSINSYLNTNGYNVTLLYENIDNAIVSFLMMNEQYIVKHTKNIEQLHHFIHLMRFNIIMDTKLNVYVRDIQAGEDFKGIEDYERIIYSTLKTVGALNYYEFECRNNVSCKMLSQSKDIVTNPQSCLDYPCNVSSSCSSSKCEMCLQCLNQVPDVLNHLHRSYREHMQCGHMKRIFPAYNNYHDGNIVNQLSSVNRLSLKWFQAKCETDSAWC